MFIADMPIGAKKKDAEPVKPAVADEPPLMRRVEDEIGLTVLSMIPEGLSKVAFQQAQLVAFRKVEIMLLDFLHDMRLGNLSGITSLMRGKDLEPKHVGKCEHDFLGWVSEYDPTQDLTRHWQTCAKCGAKRA